MIKSQYTLAPGHIFTTEQVEDGYMSVETLNGSSRCIRWSEDFNEAYEAMWDAIAEAKAELKVCV